MLVSTSLRNAGYNEFLPKYVFRRRQAGGFREVERPLFSGYVFASFDPARRLPVLMVPGVVGIAGSRRTPIPVAPHEIAVVRQIAESGLALEPWPFLQSGDRVVLEAGPLTGVEGTLVALKKRHRLVVSITVLQRSVSVEIDRTWARPLGHGSLAVPAFSLPSVGAALV